jgi:hypothetical protein
VRRVPAIVLAAVLLGACADDRVPLRYGLETGRILQYELSLQADVTGTVGGQRRTQTLTAGFGVTQEILEPLDGGGVAARMTLAPRSLSVNGVPADPGPAQKFDVDLGPDGRVVAIGETTGEPQQELAPLGIDRLLPRLRPVLPGIEVTAGETWSSRTDFGDASGSFSISTESRLAELGTVRGYRAALVRTTYRSPVNRRETYANAQADLAGTDIGAQEAWFALDGFLIRALGDSVGTYRVTFRPPEGELGVTPVEGRLVVRLHTRMELIRAA